MAGKRDWLRLGGSTDQFFGMREGRLTGGKADGMRICDVYTSAGLSMEVLPDRCMDIRRLCFKGLNLGVLSQTGPVSPALCEREGIGFLRGFTAGFLTTCGLRNVGSPCEENGEAFGLHGRIGATPAEAFRAETEWHGGRPELVLHGRMRESRLFGENLTLARTLRVKGDGTGFEIEDVVENEGFRPEAVMLLYHFNLGAPLLDAGARLVLPSLGIEPRDADAAAGVAEYARMAVPSAAYREQVFYHDLAADPEGWTFCALCNEALSMGVVIRWRKDRLGRFTQWKQMGEGAYVLGLEPCNCPVSGRVRARAEDALAWLEPGKRHRASLKVDLLVGKEALAQISQAAGTAVPGGIRRQGKTGGQ